MFRKKGSRRRWKVIGNGLFFAALFFFTILGLLLPLRPKVSEMEKRKLAEFPAFSLSGIMDGSYFTSVSEWYSDSFPLRDTWMGVSDNIKDLYGLHTMQVITGNVTKDDIPDVDVPKTTAAVPDQSVVSETEEVTEAPLQTTAVAEETTAAPPATTASSTASAEPAGTMAAITEQSVNGLMVNGDTAYGLYYFNRNAVDTYVAAVNRLAERLQGLATVYCVLVPDSTSFYVSAEMIAQTDMSDQQKAIDYYYATLSDTVKKINIWNTLEQHAGEYIYYRTDHHWTQLGAYYAFCEYAKVRGLEISDISTYERKDLPGFLGSYYNMTKSDAMAANPDTVELYFPKTYNQILLHESDGTDLNWPMVNEVASYIAYAGSDYPFTESHNPNVTNGQRCLVIKESYGNAFITWLTDYYQDIYWVDYRYYTGDIAQLAKDLGVTDVLFVDGIEPLSGLESMNRLSSLIP